MDIKELEALKTELKGATEKVKALVEKQESEIKKYGETTDATAKELKAYSEKLDAMEKEKKELADRLEKMEVKSNRIMQGASMEGRKATPGLRFIMNDGYKNARKGGMYKTDSVDVGNIFGLKTVDATALVGDGDDRAPVWPEQVPEIFFDPGQRAMTLRDLMNVGQTQSNAVEYFQETDFDPDSAASQNGETNEKAQLAMKFEKKTAAVETIAAWLPVSRQVIEDQAMLQSHIDSRLVYAVNKELEDQILFGDGTDGSLLGINNTPGVKSIGAPDEYETSLDIIRRAIAQVRLSEYAATGIIINPSDWAEIELLKGTDDRYIWGTVTDGGVSRLWRVPVIETTAMEEGRFLVGAFGLGAQLWDRMASTIRISDSHSTYFVKNMIAVLAELRAALTVYRPGAFVKGIFDDTLST